MTLTSLFLIASAAAAAENGFKPPLFRVVGDLGHMPEVSGNGPVRLLADADFPPFSFTSRDGAAAGIAVDLAMAACAELKLACQVTLKPFAELSAALKAGEADVVLSGLRIDASTFETADATRPYFRTLGRFAVQSGNLLKDGGADSLSGKRIGTVKGSAHEAWLRKYYPSSDIQSFASLKDAQEALRTGNVEALFADDIQLMFWVGGTASTNCCKLLGQAYSDLDYFSRNMAFLVRSGRGDLRAAFDYGLDRLQLNGTTEKVLNLYLPLNPW